jgi:hypothetical protein
LHLRFNHSFYSAQVLQVSYITIRGLLHPHELCTGFAANARFRAQEKHLIDAQDIRQSIEGCQRAGMSGLSTALSTGDDFSRHFPKRSWNHPHPMGQLFLWVGVLPKPPCGEALNNRRIEMRQLTE